MNQYQRMICYLYEYNRGQKGANVGYVRLEQRGDRCRVQIQMRGRNLEKPPVAAFFKQESTGVRLLKIREMKEGKGELFCRVESRVDNLLEAGRTLDEMDGIFLYVSDVLHFASTWKLQDIYAGKITWWGQDEEGEKVSEPIQPVGEQREYNQSEQAEGKPPANTDALPEKMTSMAEEDDVREESAADRDFIQERFARQEENVTEANADIYDRAAEETASGTEQEQFVPERELSVAELEEQVVCERCPFKRRELDYGKRMLVTFPAMRPFGNGYRGKCVRIEPQDLGCMPMKLWPLSGNSFLMQGYYNYRHLIFMEWEESSYAIGVPGIYSETAKERGKSAGFTEFMAICGQRNCRGAFGYWLMPLSVR